MRDKMGVNLSENGSGKELGGLEGAETVIEIYNKTIFNKRNKLKQKKSSPKLIGKKQK